MLTRSSSLKYFRNWTVQWCLFIFTLIYSLTHLHLCTDTVSLRPVSGGFRWFQVGPFSLRGSQTNENKTEIGVMTTVIVKGRQKTDRCDFLLSLLIFFRFGSVVVLSRTTETLVKCYNRPRQTEYLLPSMILHSSS